MRLIYNLIFIFILFLIVINIDCNKRAHELHQYNPGNFEFGIITSGFSKDSEHWIYLKDFKQQTENFLEIQKFAFYYLKFVYQKNAKDIDLIVLYNEDFFDPDDSEDFNKIIARIYFSCVNKNKKIRRIVTYEKGKRKTLKPISDKSEIPCNL